MPESWLLHRRARSSLILVAPHGGRRRRKIRRGDGVNDLHTAELTAELAERLDAVALINQGLDRNRIDLNRISDLVKQAPEFAELLCEEIENVPGGSATVLFMHGWNMVVPCCDIGVGLRRRGGQLYGRYPTVSRGFFDTAVAVFEQEFVRRGLRTTVGLRYPGNGYDNALQLFSGRHISHADATVRRMAQAALAGRVDAVQLELGIPLRWPGPQREALLDALTAAARTITARSIERFADQSADQSAERFVLTGGSIQAGVSAAGGGRDWQLPAANKAQTSTVDPESGFTLQSVMETVANDGVGAVDAVGTIGTIGTTGLFAGVESTGPESMAARLCLVFSDGRMLLFVGEGEWNGHAGCYQDHGLSWNRRDDGAWSIAYSGSMVAYPTHGAYEDLEAGLAAASLVEAEIELEAIPVPAMAEPFRKLRYHMKVDGKLLQGVTVAVCEHGSRRHDVRTAAGDGALATARARVCMLTGPDAPQVSRSAIFDEGSAGSLRITTSGGGERQGNIIARVPVWRVLGDGRTSRFTFGTASFDAENGDNGTAVYDRLEIFEAGSEVCA